MTDFKPTIEKPKPPENTKTFFRQYGKSLFLWIGIIAAVIFLLYLRVDEKIIAIFVVILALFTKAFAALGALIVLVPVVGPLILKVFSIPLFWIINGLGYFVSIIAIKKGYTKEVIHSRTLTVAVLVGILLGYVIGNLLPIR